MTTAAAAPTTPAAPAAPPAEPAKVEASLADAPKTEPAKSAEVDVASMGEKAGAADGVTPQDWSLAPPEGADKAAFESLTTWAKQQGLTANQAQALWSERTLAEKARRDAENDSQSRRLASMVEETRADAEIGGAKLKDSIEAGKAAIRRFGTSELVKRLGAVGLLEDPEVIRLLSRVGKAMREDGIAGAQPVQRQAINDDEARLRRRYPTHFKD